MLHLSHIPIWLNARRLGFLEDFHRDLEAYCRQVTYEAFPFRVVEDDEARAIRGRLEPRLRRCRRIVGATGRVSLLRLAPGERAGEVERFNLISKTFELERYNLGKDDVFKALAEARSAYEENRVASWIRTVNPFYWLDLFLNYVEHVPFLPLRFMGKHTARAAASPTGLAVRRTARLVALLGLVWGGLYLGGMHDDALNWLDGLASRMVP